MSDDINAPFSAVQIYLRRRMWKLDAALLFLLFLLLIGLAALIVLIAALVEFGGKGAPAYADNPAHFMYGSIGAETEGGLPYAVWKALPSLYPADFKGRSDYSAFGFLYEKDVSGRQRDLPIGISTRKVNGIDVVWMNCATCHVGTWREAAGASPHIVPGMPSNNLDLYRFIRFILDVGADERLAPDTLMPAMKKTGTSLDPLQQLVWRFYVIPRVREGLIQRRSRLEPLLAAQPPWGPGRVDTFNPYKLLLELGPGARIPDAALVGTADFPAVFDQRPREGMHQHMDVNNTSLAERNLSAALGAGVTPVTVDHASIERDAAWLLDLRPPPSPYHPDGASAARGEALYRTACAACHGWQGPGGYVFQGAKLGQVDPIAEVGTDPEPAEQLHAGLPRLAGILPVQGHALPVQPLHQDERLRQPAARWPVAARALPAQRLGPDPGRPAGAAGTAAEGVSARPRRDRPRQGRLHRAGLHARRADAGGDVLLRHQPARQQRPGPRMGNRHAAGPEGRPAGLPDDLLMISGMTKAQLFPPRESGDSRLFQEASMTVPTKKRRADPHPRRFRGAERT